MGVMMAGSEVAFWRLFAKLAGSETIRKKTAKAGNFLDLNRNKKYQLYNSLQDGLGPGWRGWWFFAQIHHPVPFIVLQIIPVFHLLDLTDSGNLRRFSFSVIGNQHWTKKFHAKKS